nr:MAG TPA: hypothetical protein [Caudoviricetes sp.]
MYIIHVDARHNASILYFKRRNKLWLTKNCLAEV